MAQWVRRGTQAIWSECALWSPHEMLDVVTCVWSPCIPVGIAEIDRNWQKLLDQTTHKAAAKHERPCLEKAKRQEQRLKSCPLASCAQHASLYLCMCTGVSTCVCTRVCACTDIYGLWLYLCGGWLHPLYGVWLYTDEYSCLCYLLEIQSEGCDHQC